MTDSKVFCYYNYQLDLKRKILKVEVKVLKDKELLFNKSTGLLFRSYRAINNHILKGIVDLLEQFREQLVEYSIIPISIILRKEDNEKLFKDLCMDVYCDGCEFIVKDYGKSDYYALGKEEIEDRINETEEIIEEVEEIDEIEEIIDFDDEIEVLELEDEPINPKVELESGIITIQADSVEDVIPEEERKLKILLKDDYENIVFVDVITNEKDNSKEIITLGGAKIDIKGITLDAFYTLVKPRSNSELTLKCIEETNITQEQIDNAENFGNVIQDFIYWVGNKKTLFMTWGEDVIDVILQECEKSDIDCEIAYDIDNNYFDLKFEFAKCHLGEEKEISLEDALKLYEIGIIKENNKVLDNSMNMIQLYNACEN